jgi:hypothetical protein
MKRRLQNVSTGETPVDYVPGATPAEALEPLQNLPPKP